MCLALLSPNSMKSRLPISPEERVPFLDARRESKKTSSAHAYVRGSTRRFYEWLESRRGRSLPEAPSIWISGDCHVGNLGPLAAKDGDISIELRDFDQTVIGSPAHDIARLSLSMAMAVRASGLPGTATARAIESIARGYELVLEASAAQRPFSPGKPPAQVLGVLRLARARSRNQLFVDRIGSKNSTSIPMGKRFWPLTADERRAVEKLVSTSKVRKLTTSLASRDDDAPVELVDAAYWVKGCSSLGLWRGAALVRVGGSKSKDGVTAILDIKEAREPLAPRSKAKTLPSQQGERVIQGARAMSPALGERMVAASILNHDVFVRELLPQDLKFELDALEEDEAMAIGQYLASLVAVAHARQLTHTECADWLTAFRKGNAKNMKAPAWLWASVVDLVALHEGAYLEHCREHALAPVERSIMPNGGVVSHHVSGD